MHDTYLLNNIAESLRQICKENKIKRINRLTLGVNHHSHINEENLREYLERHHKNIISDELYIEIQKQDIEQQTAMIHSLQGETLEV